MSSKKANAYRVISRKELEAYRSGDFSAVPNLDGAYMKEAFKGMNKNQYLDDVKYLHFFKLLGDAKNYISEMRSVAPDVDFCILEFNFDDEMLKQLAGTGFYFSNAYRKTVSIPEYIVPLEVYDAKSNFIGEVGPEELSHSYGTFIEDTYY